MRRKEELLLKINTFIQVIKSKCLICFFEVIKIDYLIISINTH